jgi:hypothetical protein
MESMCVQRIVHLMDIVIPAQVLQVLPLHQVQVALSQVALAASQISNLEFLLANRNQVVVLKSGAEPTLASFLSISKDTYN